MTSEHSRRIGEQIATARKLKGWSQEKAARKLKCSVSAWSRWERGEREPDYEQLAAIASLLGTQFVIGSDK